MAQYEIAWTFGGYTTVEAADENEAREKFRELDHSEVLRDAAVDDCLDVVGVQQSG